MTRKCSCADLVAFSEVVKMLDQQLRLGSAALERFGAAPGTSRRADRS